MTEAHLAAALTPWEAEHGAMARADVDIIDPNVEQPRYEAMIEVLRREGSITWYPDDSDEGYDGFWVVTGNELAHEALRQVPPYSSYGLEESGGLMIHDLRGELGAARQLMIMQDDPAHKQQRDLIEGSFRHRQINEIMDFLRGQAGLLVDAALDAGKIDFVTDVAGPLPLAAICERLDIPNDARDEIYAHAGKLAFSDNLAAIDVKAVEAIINAANGVRRGIARGEIHSTALEPLNAVTYRPGKGEEPTAEKFMHPFQFDLLFILLFLAGNETTRYSLSHGAKMFAEHPEQWQMLRERPELLDAATEEITRSTTPVRYVRRTNLADSQLGDAKIKAGDKVVISLTGANRDPAVFDRPHEFDITRKLETIRRSVAFGWGPHFCLGYHLAKGEIRAMLEVLSEKVERFEVIGEEQRRPSDILNNISSLMVRMTAAG